MDVQVFCKRLIEVNWSLEKGQIQIIDEEILNEDEEKKKDESELES